MGAQAINTSLDGVSADGLYRINSRWEALAGPVAQ